MLGRFFDGSSWFHAPSKKEMESFFVRCHKDVVDNEAAADCGYPADDEDFCLLLERAPRSGDDFANTDWYYKPESDGSHQFVQLFPPLKKEE